jgi:hypothetical protein
MFFGGSLGLVALSILRFTAVDHETIHEVLMNVYYCFLGVLTVSINLNLQKVQDNFRFMNYYWGKSCYCLFLSSMAFSTNVEAFIQYVMTFYFMVAALLFLYLSVADRETDKDQYKKDLKGYKAQTVETSELESLPLIGAYLKTRFESEVDRAAN